MRMESQKSVDFGILVPEYVERFPMEMAVLRIGGVYPGEQAEGFIDPYTKTVDNEYFGNVGEHCIAVANLSEILAKSVLGNDPLVKKITSRGLVHDATKRYEVMRKKAVKAGIIDIKDAYSKQAYQTIKPLLEAKGIAPDIIEYMAEAGSETGHPSLPDFLKIENGDPILIKDNNLPQVIVHLADDMTSTPIVREGEKAETHYLTFPERMVASDFRNRYPGLFKQGFGFNENGKVELIDDVLDPHPELIHVKTNIEWQTWVAREMSKYLVSLITEEQVPDSEKYLKNLANSSLVSQI